MKFHGIYQQDDRDLRDERRRQKLEPRLPVHGPRAPAGRRLHAGAMAEDRRTCPRLWQETLRLTTRQTFQFHWLLKDDLRATIQGLHDVLLDTIAACGDDARGVMCSVNPHLSALHAEVTSLAKRGATMPSHGCGRIMRSGTARSVSRPPKPEEPFYGRTYHAAKVQDRLRHPAVNDIDVYAQDLGFIAIADEAGLQGFNVAIGGGMGRTDQAPATYPRLADVIGFVTPDERAGGLPMRSWAFSGTTATARSASHARFKYTIDDRGLDWIKARDRAAAGLRRWSRHARIELRLERRPRSAGQTGDDGRHHFDAVHPERTHQRPARHADGRPSSHRERP